MKFCHPDVNPGKEEESQETAKEVTEAFEELRDRFIHGTQNLEPGSHQSVFKILSGPPPKPAFAWIIFLDDSGSMSGTNLELGKQFYGLLEPTIDPIATEVILFGSSSHQKVVHTPENIWGFQLSMWNATSGGTYMWKRVEDYVVKLKEQNRFSDVENINVLIMTDGYDNCSPGEYYGREGFNPMMETITRLGVNLTINIVGIGAEFFEKNEEGKKTETILTSLCLATGGRFLWLKDALKETKESAKEYVSRFGEKRVASFYQDYYNNKWEYERRVKLGFHLGILSGETEWKWYKPIAA